MATCVTLLGTVSNLGDNIFSGPNHEVLTQEDCILTPVLGVDAR